MGVPRSQWWFQCSVPRGSELAYAVTVTIIITRQSIDCIMHMILNDQCYMLVSMCIIVLPDIMYMDDWKCQKYVILMRWYEWHEVYIKGSHSRIIWCMFILPAMCLISSLSCELTSPQLCCQFKIQVQRLTHSCIGWRSIPLVLSTVCTFCRPSVQYKSYLRSMYFDLTYRGSETVYVYISELTWICMLILQESVE